MIKYKIEDFSVININGKKIDLSYKIKKVFDRRNMVIILLEENTLEEENYSDSLPYNEIYAFSANGECLWNIEIFFRPDNVPNGIKALPMHRFIDADIDEKGNLVVYTDMGVGYILDIDEKQIIGYFKREKIQEDGKGQRIQYYRPSETILEVNGKRLDFSYNIKTITEVNNMLIVCLDSPRRDSVRQPQNGIYAVSAQGEIIWNIEEFFRPNSTYKYGSPIEIYDYTACDGQYLEVHTYDGIKYTIDIKKKQIVSKVGIQKKG